MPREDTPAKRDPSADGLVVLNPSAGKGKPDQIKKELSLVLGTGSYDLHETAEGENLREAVQTAVQQKPYEWVAAVGGDGTVSQVADGLVGSEVPLAIIPAGTGNVLAQVLGIPTEIEAACELIKSERKTIRRIDSIQVGQQHFFLQLGIGLESKTMENTSSAQKNRWGMAAYIWTLVKEAFGWQPHRFDLTVDGQTRHIQASELVIANSSHIGLLNLEWSQTISPFDGQIDIAVIRARSLVDYVRVIAALLFNKQQESNHIQFFTAQQNIKLASEKSLPIHGDGEILAEDTPLTAVVVSEALKVIVP